MTRLLTALFLCASAAFADTLVLKDGSRIDGTLQTCDDKRCTVDGKKIARDQIARIELLSVARIPPAAGAGSIVFVDGTSRSTHFVSLDRRIVYTEGSEIARGEVAMIILAVSSLAPLPRAVPDDLLVLAGGAKREGRLATCTPAICTLDSDVVPVNTVRWIGLKSEDTEPPAASVTEDLIFVKGAPVAARMTAIDANTVRTTKGSFARNDVTWIHIAPPVIETPKPTTAEQSTEVPKPPPPPPQPPSPKKNSPPPPPPPPPPGGKKGFQRGGLWSGQIHTHYRLTFSDGPGYTDFKTDIAAHLREYRYLLLRLDNGKRYGVMTKLESEGTEIRTKYEVDQQNAVAGTHCSGSGTLSVTTTPDGPGGHASVIYSSNIDADTTPWIGFPIVRGTPRYVVSINAQNEFPVRCDSWVMSGSQIVRTSSSMTQPYFPLPLLGKLPISGCPFGDKVVCDPQIRTIVGQNGRMSGAFHNQERNDVGHNVDLQVRWSLCRDDAPCKDEPPEPEKDPCGSPATQRALMDTIWNQRQMEARQLASDFQKLTEANAALQDNLEAWRAAIPTCAIAEIVNKALNEMLKGLAGESGELTDAVGKIVSGDLSGFVGDKSYSNIIELITTDVELVKAAVGVGDPAAMQEKIDDCAVLPDNLKEGARAFVDAYAEVKSLMPQVQSEVNDVHSKDQAYWDQWQQYYQACLEHAECKGVTPDCVKPPSQPSGPMPGQETTLPTGPPH